MTIPKREKKLVDRKMFKSNIHHKTRQSPLKTYASVRPPRRCRVFFCPIKPAFRSPSLYLQSTDANAADKRQTWAAQFANKSAVPAALDMVVTDMLRGGSHRGPDSTL